MTKFNVFVQGPESDIEVVHTATDLITAAKEVIALFPDAIEIIVTPVEEARLTNT